MQEIKSDEIQCNKHIEVMNGSEMLNNRYRLGKKIGEGGLSEVYDVRDMYSEYFSDSRCLVAKIPSSKIAKKKDIIAFVYAEYSLLNTLNHINIVKAVDFGIDEKSNISYLVMEKLEGSLLVNIPLFEINKQMKESITLSLYKAIVYIQAKNIVHADINPTNIMTSMDGEAVLFDFGISQQVNSEKEFQLAYDKVNAYNPIYAAPELFDGALPSYKSDLFSVACVLYEIYTEKLPFSISSTELLNKPVGYKALNEIPFSQRYWFKKALSYDKNDRPDNIPLSIRIKLALAKCASTP